MTVAVETPYTSYVGDGSTAAFALNFTYTDAADVVATVSVGGLPVTAGYAVSGGNAVFSTAPAAGASIVLKRMTPRRQLAQFPPNGNFPSADTGVALDRLTREQQEQDLTLGRAVVVPDGESGLTLPPAAARAGLFAGFDALGGVVPLTGTGADAGLRTDLASTTGASLVKMADGRSVQQAVLGAALAKTCFIAAFIGQSLTIARTPQVTTAYPANLLQPVGGSEWPTFTNPAPLSVSSRAAVPAHFASFVPYAPVISADSAPSLGEGLAPGFAAQFLRAMPGQTVIACATGLGGTALSLHVAGGGAQGGQSGPFMANLQMYLRAAVKWARAQGLSPRIIPIYIQGHADADLLNDGGTATVETTTAQYVAGLTKLARDIRAAAQNALGYPFTDPIWLQPLLTGQGSSQYTLAGRRQVANAQVQACSGSVPGMMMVPPISQLAPWIATDLVHPLGQGFRYNGELLAAAVLGWYAGVPQHPPYIVAKQVVSSTQVTVTFDQPVQISGLVTEASTSGVMAGLELYNGSGTQIPLLGVNVSGAVATLTVANTSGAATVRNGLAQENTGANTKFPRTRIAGLVNLGTTIDGMALGNFSAAQEF